MGERYACSTAPVVLLHSRETNSVGAVTSAVATDSRTAAARGSSMDESAGALLPLAAGPEAGCALCGTSMMRSGGAGSTARARLHRWRGVWLWSQ